MNFDLSPDQRQVLNALWQWLKYKSSTEHYITVGGYAGTGKTTSLAAFRSHLRKAMPKKRVAFVSFTGKAARVLKNALEKAKVVFPEDFTGTIHSLIYSPILSDSQEIIGWDRKKSLDYDLIIIDEASMVDYIIWQDLKAYGVPIIAVGDHGQLPPIHGNFNLVEKPHLKLEKIHRQAEGNPIIQLSMLARENGEIPVGRYGEGIEKLARDDYDSQEVVERLLRNFTAEILILCGYNSTRVRLNNFVRTTLGFEEPEPQPGDRVICLRNNHKKNIYNGMIGEVNSLQKDSPEWYFAEIEFEESTGVFKGLISVEQFNAANPRNFSQQRAKTLAGDLFDFGYALTVHKAQGSQAKKVVLFEERFKQMDDAMWRRWLYTAVTRAEEELYILV